MPQTLDVAQVCEFEFILPYLSTRRLKTALCIIITCMDNLRNFFDAVFLHCGLLVGQSFTLFIPLNCFFVTKGLGERSTYHCSRFVRSQTIPVHSGHISDQSQIVCIDIVHQSHYISAYHYHLALFPSDRNCMLQNVHSKAETMGEMESNRRQASYHSQACKLAPIIGHLSGKF